MNPPVPQQHPQPDDAGRPVLIRAPSEPSALAAWGQRDAIAAVVPGGPLPSKLNGVALTQWADPPVSVPGWEELAAGTAFEEPPFEPPDGLEPAAGAVVVEADGRVWLVCPTNGHGGYGMTFPKGRLDGKSLRAAAMAETYEESGLRVELTDFLLDVQRSQTFTRYYRAHRVGGSPAGMGWESQCVVLASQADVLLLKLHHFDRQVLKSLQSERTK